MLKIRQTKQGNLLGSEVFPKMESSKMWRSQKKMNRRSQNVWNSITQQRIVILDTTASLKKAS